MVEQKRIPKGYYLVNPAGAIHLVTKEHAAERLREPGFRMATREEIQVLVNNDFNQRADALYAPAWAPVPVGDDGEPAAGDGAAPVENG